VVRIEREKHCSRCSIDIYHFHRTRARRFGSGDRCSGSPRSVPAVVSRRLLGPRLGRQPRRIPLPRWWSRLPPRPRWPWRLEPRRWSRLALNTEESGLRTRVRGPDNRDYLQHFRSGGLDVRRGTALPLPRRRRGARGRRRIRHSARGLPFRAHLYRYPRGPRPAGSASATWSGLS
jgi:hypothetical protein